MIFGRAVEVDLTKKSVVVKKIPHEITRAFIGGRGLGIYYLHQMVGPEVGPLSPDNVLIFSVGPTCGTFAPSSGLYCLTTKSPLTGTCLSAHSGGHFGPALRYAGIDALIVHGVSDKPCYILVDNERVEILDAESLWGLDAKETTNTLCRKYRDLHVATIGPAGENQVLMSSVINDYARAAARGGPGAVMGSKKLKAIAVRGTTSPVHVGNPSLFEKCVGEASLLIKERGVSLTANGTPGVVEVANASGILPTLNFQTAYFTEANAIDAKSLKQLRVKNQACFSCAIGCSKVNRKGDVSGEGPEYETIYAMGSNCGNGDIASIVRLNELSNRLGIDTISTGATIAFAMELFQRGIISEADTGGLKLEWGKADIMEEVMIQIAYKKGLGKFLSDGSWKAAQHFGPAALHYAMHVKGLEPAGYDPRGILGMGLAYATSNRGACHLRAMMHVVEIFQGKLDRFSWTGKAEVLKELQDISSVIDSLVMCKFAARHGFDNSPEKLGLLLSAIFDETWDAQQVSSAGERIYNLERLYNFQMGFSRKDDILPDRFFSEPIPNGPTKGRCMDGKGFKEALDEYYRRRGWDSDGRPSDKKLQSLGIDKLMR
jgi:aldehyde:ferredoxin oxidoreductase